jgi:hypothetical protein
MRVNIITPLSHLAILVIVAGLASGQLQADLPAPGDPVVQQTRQGKAIRNNAFPSISTFLHLDSFDQLQTPQADLSPTNFFSAERFNSFDSLSGLPKPNFKEPEIVGITPESFSIPQISLNLEEPEIVGQNPVLFSSIPGSDPHLFSTAASVITAFSEQQEDNTNEDGDNFQGDSATQELLNEQNQQPNTGRYRRSDLLFWKNLALFRNRQLKNHNLL